MVDPMALRPRLSTGLLFSDIVQQYYSKRERDFTFQNSKIDLQE
jgi:hypothetical protein